jgi:hypothetical protein
MGMGGSVSMAASLGMAVVAAATADLVASRGHASGSPAILRSWLFVFSVAIALTGCTSLDAKTGVGGAARGSREFELGYGSERPVELPVPAPDVNADATQAIKEIESRRKADALMRENQGQPARRPYLDHDVTQGIQVRRLDKALGR